MRRNLDALSLELYNAVSNWNDTTEAQNGSDKILTEAEVGEYASSAYEHILVGLHEEGLL